MNTERYDNIDLMETIGILLVVSYHATTVDYGIIDGRGYEIFNYIIRAFLSAGVPFFFFANGFCL